MKKLSICLIFYIFLSIPNLLIGQELLYKFYIDKYEGLIKDSSKAVAIRVIEVKNDTIWEAKDFYLTGEVKGKCFFLVDKKHKNKYKHGRYFYYYSNGNKKTEGFYNRGNKTGREKGYYESGNIDYEYVYDSLGKIKDRKYYKEDGSISNYQEPSYEGGEKEMNNFIAQNLRYPIAAHKQRIQGKVLLSFKVCEDGTVCNFEVIESPDKTLSDEAIRVMEKMPKWQPAIRDDKKITITYTVPFEFSINK